VLAVHANLTALRHNDLAGFVEPAPAGDSVDRSLHGNLELVPNRVAKVIRHAIVLVKTQDKESLVNGLDTLRILFVKLHEPLSVLGPDVAIVTSQSTNGRAPFLVCETCLEGILHLGERNIVDFFAKVDLVVVAGVEDYNVADFLDFFRLEHAVPLHPGDSSAPKHARVLQHVQGEPLEDIWLQLLVNDLLGEFDGRAGNVGRTVELTVDTLCSEQRVLRHSRRILVDVAGVASVHVHIVMKACEPARVRRGLVVDRFQAFLESLGVFPQELIDLCLGQLERLRVDQRFRDLQEELH